MRANYRVYKVSGCDDIWVALKQPPRSLFDSPGEKMYEDDGLEYETPIAIEFESNFCYNYPIEDDDFNMSDKSKSPGGDVSLSTSWQVLHTIDDLPEDQLQTQKQHWEHIVAEEQVFRKANPDYPADRSILPLSTETIILHHEFSNVAAKGCTSLHGGLQKLTLGGTSWSQPSFSRSYGFSSEAQKIQELESQIARQNETMATWREEIITQIRSEFSQQASQGQHYPYQTQGSYYPPQPASQPRPPPSQQSSQEEQYMLNREQWEKYQRFLQWESSMGNQ